MAIQRKFRLCKIHGICQHYLQSDKHWRCTNCNTSRVSTRRKKLKDILLSEHGSRCIDCGFQGPPFMFDFDHREPSKKEFGLGTKGLTRSLDKLREEALKCDLVCARCHRMRTHKQRCSGCIYCGGAKHL